MTSTIKDGGPAFPVTLPDGQGYGGMTLLDWFAGQALAGILANPTNSNLPAGSQHTVAQAAYIAADAMISQRDNTL